MVVPKINDFCKVNYDGRVSDAIVVSVDKIKHTFDIITSYNNAMCNIPFEKFKPMPDLGGLIINMLNDKYSLDLKTVDAMSMNDDINEMIENKRWMIELLAAEKNLI